MAKNVAGPRPIDDAASHLPGEGDPTGEVAGDAPPQDPTGEITLANKPAPTQDDAASHPPTTGGGMKTADASMANALRRPVTRYFVALRDRTNRAQAFTPSGKIVDFVDGVGEIEEEDIPDFSDENRFLIQSHQSEE